MISLLLMRAHLLHASVCTRKRVSRKKVGKTYLFRPIFAYHAKCEYIRSIDRSIIIRSSSTPWGAGRHGAGRRSFADHQSCHAAVRRQCSPSRIVRRMWTAVGRPAEAAPRVHMRDAGPTQATTTRGSHPLLLSTGRSARGRWSRRWQGSTYILNYKLKFFEILYFLNYRMNRMSV